MRGNSPRVGTAQHRGALTGVIFIAAFLTYNSNGREIQSYDSQPTKFAARELALKGKLTLDDVVAAAPALAERHSFQRDLAGHYRSAYSPVPSIEGAIVALLLHGLRLVDLKSAPAPGWIAVITASLLTSAAVALVFSALSRRTSPRVALIVAIGLAFGTNFWPLASRSLWEMETVSFGLAVALHSLLRSPETTKTRHIWCGGTGLALAGAARMETAPIIAVLLCSLVIRVGLKRAIPAIGLVATTAIVMMTAQWMWFGSVVGAKTTLVAAGLAAHDVTGPFSRQPWDGATGLLLSPSRGLIVFSPIVLIPMLAMPKIWSQRDEVGERWWTAAGLLQYVAYSFYSVWWGGHTYGPRYLVDVFIPLTPAAATGVMFVAARRWSRVAGMAALAWSIIVAATGAFCYPNDGWNTDPVSVDTHHERLWNWRDPQIIRCWRRGLSPQNFSLFERAT